MNKKRHITDVELDFSNPKELGSLLARIENDNLSYRELKSLLISLIQRVSFYLYNRFVHDT